MPCWASQWLIILRRRCRAARRFTCCGSSSPASPPCSSHTRRRFRSCSSALPPRDPYGTCRAAPDRRQSYLTYDDGPNPNATPALLDVLRDGGAHATFFLIDAHVTEATAPIVRRMFDEGHTVALHSDTRVLVVKTPSELAALLTRNADHIEQLAGSRPCRLFRPHAGWRSGSMYEGLASIIDWLAGVGDYGTGTGINRVTPASSRAGSHAAHRRATSS